MDRRDALKLLGAISVNAYAVPAMAGPCSGPKMFGALAPTAPIIGRRFHEEFSTFKGLGRQLAKERKNVFLWKFLEKELGHEIIPYWQGPDPETGNAGEGDCVGQAAAMACNVLAATDIWLRDEAEQFVAEASVEMLYGGSRWEIGVKGRPEENPNRENSLQGRGGSHGEWVARFVNEYGVLHRLIYAGPEGPLDLTGYDPGRSRIYRDKGVPDWLEAEARKHPVRAIANIRTGMEGVDAICAGHPVVVCSSYAFKDQRNVNGFAEAYGAYRQWGRWFRVQWWHAMVATGVVFLPDGTIGILIQNSHGDWNEGPRAHGQPRGSFFVTLPTFELMVKDWFDCWSFGSYHGHEADKVKKRIHKLWR